MSEGTGRSHQLLMQPVPLEQAARAGLQIKRGHADGVAWVAVRPADVEGIGDELAIDIGLAAWRPGKAQPEAARHSSSGTARVATTEARRQTELPGWFWTALGCMTVLVVGLTVVFFVFQPSGPSTPAGAGATPLPAAATTTTLAPSAPAAAPDVQRPQPQGIRVERMTPPPPAIDQVPAAAVKPKARPIKVARTPVAKPAGGAAAAKPAAAESEGEANEEELLKPKQRPAATAQDDDGEKE